MKIPRDILILNLAEEKCKIKRLKQDNSRQRLILAYYYDWYYCYLFNFFLFQNIRVKIVLKYLKVKATDSYLERKQVLTFL